MYPFHPRYGETVPVQRRFAYRGVDLVAIPQPDGSVACIPEWMTHERAARLKLSTEPQFSLENLRSLRVEIDALLAFLLSDLKREPDGHEAQKHKSREAAAATVRSRPAMRALLPAQKARLSVQVEALFIEIAEALATGEAGDEQDHR
jgi:hypothetical protein